MEEQLDKMVDLLQRIADKIDNIDFTLIGIDSKLETIMKDTSDIQFDVTELNTKVDNLT